LSLLHRRWPFWLALLVYLPCLLAAVHLRLLFPDIAVTIGIYFLIILGLDLLFGYTGQLSLGHQGFFAIGAYTLAITTRIAHWNPWLGLLTAMLVNLLLALTLGPVLLRLSGVYFMLGTLAFGLIVHAVLVVWHPITGGEQGIGSIQRLSGPHGPLITDAEFGALVWGAAFALFWFTLNVADSRLGRAMRAIRGDQVAAAAHGIDITRVKITVFSLSVTYTSLAGSLFASYIGTVHPDSFTIAALLDVLLMLFVGGVGTQWGGLLGSLVVRILPDLSSVFANYRILVNGLIFTLVLFLLPDGLASVVHRLQRARRPTPLATSTAVAANGVTVLQRISTRESTGDGRVSARAPTEPVLVVEDVSRYFGGVRAVDNVSFMVANGQIKGIIGPNGAGKSTLLNVISGLDRAQAGRIRFAGRDVTALRADQIARLGMGRTFQNLRLFNDLTVLENVLVGCYRGLQGGFGDLMRVGLPMPGVLSEESVLRSQASEWIAAVGLEAFTDVPAGALAYGHRKKVELARAVACRPRLLLLDEPVAGLNEVEKVELRTFIAGLRDSGTTIVLIEHDMEFVMNLCDEILVLNFGVAIAEGPPSTVQCDEAVLQAYLGV
jgi:ABC-type branched-subunit amino acid transport system ATPase component/ABC-type branched-subunit amino acid transport system permease subunit